MIDGASKEVENDFDRLRQLIFIEEFKRCLPSDLETHLERKISVDEAATLADGYALTHKSFDGQGARRNVGHNVTSNKMKQDETR